MFLFRILLALSATSFIAAFRHSISKPGAQLLGTRLNLRPSFGDDFDASKKPPLKPTTSSSTADEIVPVDQRAHHEDEVSFEYTVPEKIALSLLNPESAEIDVWTSRRKITRSFITPSIKKAKEREEELAEKIASGEEQLSTEEQRKEIQEKRDKATIIITAGMVAGAGVILRLGGRGALISVLGLDFAKDTGIVDGLTNLINFVSPEHLGSFSYVAFLGLWCIAKVLCIDTATILLALSSGVIFHGVLAGTVISVVCGTIASSCNFALARTSLREKTRKIINKKPTLRAIDRYAPSSLSYHTCSHDGSHTNTPISFYSYSLCTNLYPPLQSLQQRRHWLQDCAHFTTLSPPAYPHRSIFICLWCHLSWGGGLPIGHSFRVY